MGEQQTFTLPAGTVCKRNNISFTLRQATQIACHPGVWPLIKGEPPEVLEVDVVNPVHPLAPAGAVELVPLLKRLIELLEVAARPATATYSFAGEAPSNFAPQVAPTPERELAV